MSAAETAHTGPPTRIAIIGCTGRMGRALLRLAAADPSLRLAAAVSQADDPLQGADAGLVAGIGSLGLPIRVDISTDVDVAIEFSSPAGLAHWSGWCAARPCALVSGSTGLADEHQAALRAAAARIPVVWSANMSIGVNLLLALVEQAAARLDAGWDVEISEIHHRHKADAPSGTARMLLEAVGRGRGHAPDADVRHGRVGQTGARPRGQIGMHALRLGEVVGDHEVHFASAQEIISFRHHAQTRDAFAAGALRAARWVTNRPAGLYHMRDVLA